MASFPENQITVSDVDLYLGGNNANVFMPNGLIDEIRLSNGLARSPEWIQTSYCNQNDPTAFLTMGNQETAP